jgi:Aldo/keto reductase family
VKFAATWGVKADSPSRSAGSFAKMTLMRHCRRRRQAVQSAYPQYTRADQSAAGRWQGGKDNFDREVTPAAFDVIEGQAALARDKGCTPAQLALAWNAAQPGVTAPIIGPRTLEQLVDNLGATNVQVTDDDRALRCARAAVLRDAALLRRRDHDRLQAELRALVTARPNKRRLPRQRHDELAADLRFAIVRAVDGDHHGLTAAPLRSSRPPCCGRVRSRPG